jgi:hypothetical protein
VANGPADLGNNLQVVVRSDGPGIVEVPALDVPRIAIYAGRPVRLNCSHGTQSHYGLAIHGDIDIIPDGTASRWEMKEAHTALVVKISRNRLREVAAESGSMATSRSAAGFECEIRGSSTSVGRS